MEELHKVILEEFIHDLILLNPCPKCKGDGYIITAVNHIEHGINAGMEEWETEDCDECKGTRSECEAVAFLQKRLRYM